MDGPKSTNDRTPSDGAMSTAGFGPDALGPGAAIGPYKLLSILGEGGIERIRKIICEEEPKTPSTRLSKTSGEESKESAKRRQTDVRTLQRKLRGDLDWITLKALEKDRTRRYATVDAMATDINNYLTHQPVSAAPPGTLYRAKKFARRHRQALAVLALVLLLLLVGGLLTTIMYARVAQEHAHAQSLEHRRMLDDAHVLVRNMRYKEALAIDPDHYDSLRERAYIYYAQKDWQKMGEDAARMIGLRSGNPAGHLLRAIARREQGRWEEAIEDHTATIDLAPQDAPLYLERRETYMRMGKYDLALADAQQAADLDPENLYYEVMVFVARVALGQYEQAEQQYRRLTSRPLTEAELRGYWLGTIVPMNPKDYFLGYAAEYSFQTRDWERPWAPPPEKPRCHIFWRMRESAQYHERLSRRGRRIAQGGGASWSPDGTKIVYTQGTHRAYATAILDLKTGTTELLTIPGNTPEWSPDGRYIAFVRGRENMSVDTVVSPLRWVEKFRRMSRDPGAADEIWIIDLDTHDMRCIAKGSWPTWSSDSKRIYFTSWLPEGGTISWASLEDDPPVVRQVLAGCDSGAAVVSPNERYVADAAHRWLRVFDVQSRQVVAEWIAPSFPANLHFNWSPDSRELSVSGFLSLMSGVWILDTQTGEARRMLAGSAGARWSPDRSKMAVTPYGGLWLFDVDPNLPTAEALGEARTVEDHCRELIEYYTRGVAADPNYIDSHLRRTDAALWINDSNAPKYLSELEAAFSRSPYHAGGCAVRAQAILSGPPELRDRLLPLAVLLARVAAAKNPNLARPLGQALYRAGEREEATKMLKPCQITSGPGSTRYDQTTDSYTITGIGADIWDLADDFHFAYKTLHGDGSITARVDSIANTHPWAKAGVMIRESLAADSRHAFCCITPGNGNAFHNRRETDQRSWNSNTEGLTAPYWVRLVRKGDTFSAYHSPDGVTWTLQPASAETANPQTIVMAENVHIGLAVSSGNASRTAEARISHVTVTGSVTPIGPFTESQDITFQLPR